MLGPPAHDGSAGPLHPPSVARPHGDLLCRLEAVANTLLGMVSIDLCISIVCSAWQEVKEEEEIRTRANNGAGSGGVTRKHRTRNKNLVIAITRVERGGIRRM
jgi:hypothetical protein